MVLVWSVVVPGFWGGAQADKKTAIPRVMSLSKVVTRCLQTGSQIKADPALRWRWPWARITGAIVSADRQRIGAVHGFFTVGACLGSGARRYGKRPLSPLICSAGPLGEANSQTAVIYPTTAPVAPAFLLRARRKRIVVTRIEGAREIKTIGVRENNIASFVRHNAGIL